MNVFISQLHIYEQKLLFIKKKYDTIHPCGLLLIMKPVSHVMCMHLYKFSFQFSIYVYQRSSEQNKRMKKLMYKGVMYNFQGLISPTISSVYPLYEKQCKGLIFYCTVFHMKIFKPNNRDTN